MRQLLTIITLTGFTTLVSASPLYHPLGPNLTFGDVAHGQSIMSGINNPAAGVTAIRDEGDSVQFSVWSGFGAGYEIGGFDNLNDEIDTYSGAFETGGIDGSSEGQVAGDLNIVLAQIEEDGYLKTLFTFQMPIVPIIVSSDLLGGSLVFDAYVSATSNVNLLHQWVDVSDVTEIGSTSKYIVTGNDTTLLLKAATIRELSLGYSRLISSTSAGGIHAGIRGKYLKVGLVQANERLDSNVDFEQAFDDINKDDLNYSTGFGIDIGLLLISKHYRLGATLTNINEPSYEYNAIDSADYKQSSDVYQLILAESTYTMEAQLKLEAALFTQNEHWVLGLGVDANSIADGVGDDYQWATLSAAYISNSWILPGVRMGLRQNLAGSELSFVTGGFTLFSFLNLDIAYGLETVEVDGESESRSILANLGLELTF